MKKFFTTLLSLMLIFTWVYGPIAVQGGVLFDDPDGGGGRGNTTNTSNNDSTALEGEPGEFNTTGGGAGGGTTGGGAGAGTTGGGAGGGVTGGGEGGGVDLSFGLKNPLKYDSICQLLTAVLRLVTQVGAIIAVIMIIWSGFKFISAQGNTTKLQEAKKTFFNVILGTAILLGASAIAQIIVRTIFTITNKENPGICTI
jgi:hypothetical protein